MTQQTINTGTYANDRSGDSLLAAFTKINQNFTELYASTGGLDLLNVPSHIIPAANNTYDLGSPSKQWRHGYFATGSLYLGDIKISNDAGTLVVQQVTNPGQQTEEIVPDTPGVVTTDRIINGDNTFVITADGTLELNGNPFTGGSGGSELTNGTYNFTLGVDGTINFDPSSNGKGVLQTIADLQFTAGVNTWVFGQDGSITLPSLTNTGYVWNDSNTGSTLQLGVSTTQTIITGPIPTESNPASQRIIIQGQRGYGHWGQNTAGEGGDIYLWAGVGGESDTGYGGTGGDIKIRGGQGQDAEGGYVKIEAGDAAFWNATTNGNGGRIDVIAGSVTEAGGATTNRGGDIRFTAGRAFNQTAQSGAIVLTTGGTVNAGGDTYSWTFDNDGSLTVPNGIKRNNAKINFNENGVGALYLTPVSDDYTAIYVAPEDLEIYSQGLLNLYSGTSRTIVSAINTNVDENHIIIVNSTSFPDITQVSGGTWTLFWSNTNYYVNTVQVDTPSAGFVAITLADTTVSVPENASVQFRSQINWNQFKFNPDGTLEVPSLGGFAQNNTWTCSVNTNVNAPANSAVVWTSKVNYISGAKLTIQVEAHEIGDATGWHSQVCEAVIASRGYASSFGGPGGEPVMTVYGVTHTSSVPLVTFSVQRNPVTKKIEVVGTMTAAADGGADLRIYSVETSTRD